MMTLQHVQTCSTLLCHAAVYEIPSVYFIVVHVQEIKSRSLLGMRSQLGTMASAKLDSVDVVISDKDGAEDEEDLHTRSLLKKKKKKKKNKKKKKKKNNKKNKKVSCPGGINVLRWGADEKGNDPCHPLSSDFNTNNGKYSYEVTTTTLRIYLEDKVVKQFIPIFADQRAYVMLCRNEKDIKPRYKSRYSLCSPWGKHVCPTAPIPTVKKCDN
eukprot:TRINITY_DN304_c1_g1_i7.p1 TRINITY_DN304_c1_g1~~TRINITY_DN304_c1_g1_i7.p1  ORF type:complete len:234 (-),score=8.68 TRINITY_DN304_c1_g1_i7:111-749(-)